MAPALFECRPVLVRSVQTVCVALLFLLLAGGAQAQDNPPCLQETARTTCHRLASCENTGTTATSFECMCFEGTVDLNVNLPGTACSDEGFTVRAAFSLTPSASSTVMQNIMDDAIILFSNRLVNNNMGNSIVAQNPPYYNSISQAASILSRTASVHRDEGSSVVTLNPVFADQPAANQALANVIDDKWATLLSKLSHDYSVTIVSVDSPKVYRWVTDTSSNEYQMTASGFEVQNVFFNPACGSVGCWTIDIFYTTGADAMNVLYLPRVNNPTGDAQEASFYSQWTSQYQASSFPCHTRSGDATQQSTACCLLDFVAGYRVITSFDDFISTSELANDCAVSGDYTSAPESGDYTSVGVDYTGNLFPDMTDSSTGDAGVRDKYATVHNLRIELDEMDLRKYAGTVSGTTGVETVIETFIGMANFKATDGVILDSFNSQTSITLERTDTFTASSFGSNTLSFVRNLNLRLNQVYDRRDTVTVNDPPTNQKFQYVAVSYVVANNMLSPDLASQETVVPLDSIRIARGDRKPNVQFWRHACGDDEETVHSAVQGWWANYTTQPCSPTNRQLCDPPSSFPDSFVAFNVPLPINYLSPVSGTQSLFIEFVAIAKDSNGKDAKTLVAGQVPVTRAGMTLWCEVDNGLTDLRAVAAADLIAGIATNRAELEQIRTFADVENSIREPLPSTEVNFASREDAMLALVVKGDPLYFLLPRAKNYSLELEDAMTIHIMENVVGNNSILHRLVDLIDRGIAFTAENDYHNLRSHIHPTERLLNLCGWAPLPPTDANMFPTTCVMRREWVDRDPIVRFQDRRFLLDPPDGVYHPGGVQNAIEIDPDNTTAASLFMQDFLGKTDYAAQAGDGYVKAIHEKYVLNGRYMRAWFFNPSYEWNPRQTAAQRAYQLSPYLIFFALVNLCENYCTGGWVDPNTKDPCKVECLEVDYLVSGVKCFRACPTPCAWEECQTECNGLGGNLGWIASQEEHDTIVDMVDEWEEPIWIGYNDLKQNDGEWEWIGVDLDDAFIVIMRLLDYLNWIEGYPVGGLDPNSESAIIRAGKDDTDCAFFEHKADGKWRNKADHTASCTNEQSILCSYVDLTPGLNLSDPANDNCIELYGIIWEEGVLCFEVFFAELSIPGQNSASAPLSKDGAPSGWAWTWRDGERFCQIVFGNQEVYTAWDGIRNGTGECDSFEWYNWNETVQVAGGGGGGGAGCKTEPCCFPEEGSGYNYQCNPVTNGGSPTGCSNQCGNVFDYYRQYQSFPFVYEILCPNDVLYNNFAESGGVTAVDMCKACFYPGTHDQARDLFEDPANCRDTITGPGQVQRDHAFTIGYTTGGRRSGTVAVHPLTKTAKTGLFCKECIQRAVPAYNDSEYAYFEGCTYHAECPVDNLAAYEDNIIPTTLGYEPYEGPSCTLCEDVLICKVAEAIVLDDTLHSSDHTTMSIGEIYNRYFGFPLRNDNHVEGHLARIHTHNETSLVVDLLRKRCKEQGGSFDENATRQCWSQYWIGFTDLESLVFGAEAHLAEFDEEFGLGATLGLVDAIKRSGARSDWWQWTGTYTAFNNETGSTWYTNWYKDPTDGTPDDMFVEEGYKNDYHDLWGLLGPENVTQGCAMMADARDFLWDDADCQDRKYYVCSFPWNITDNATNPLNEPLVPFSDGDEGDVDETGDNNDNVLRRSEAIGADRRTPSGRKLLMSVQERRIDATNRADMQLVQYDVQARDIIADVVKANFEEAFPDVRVTAWDFEVQLTDQEACMPVNDLKVRMRDTLRDLVDTAGQGVVDVQFASVDVQKGDLVCDRRQGLARRLLAGATGRFETLLVLENSEARVDTAALGESDLLISVAPLDDGAAEYVEEGIANAGKGKPQGKPGESDTVLDKDTDSSGENGALIGGICGGVGVVLLAAVGLVIWKRQQTTETVVIGELEQVDMKSHSQQELVYQQEHGPPPITVQGSGSNLF
eukprot:CAMPEP_0181305558 /NCGR_PEP_ID=MMETSP1101-20121128/9798_1 /TAXON_ID=46948 /ORGANISM="Rhodomonas abbreviata, Strain Caron Lab Isolate" /LENGTH=1946 /DNA_ID=CAMNT_0023411491 /DNA_START=290 /DNA_END=6130 /DNA_ORIENTATION=-